MRKLRHALKRGHFLSTYLFSKNMTQVQQWEVRLLRTVDKMDWDMESWPPHESWEFMDLPWLVVVTLRSQELAFLCVPNSPLQILLVMFIRSSWQRKPTAVLHLAREKETLDPVSENIFIAFAVHFPTGETALSPSSGVTRVARDVGEACCRFPRTNNSLIKLGCLP